MELKAPTGVGSSDLFGGVVTISKISGQLSGRAETAGRVGARANQSRKQDARHDQKSALASPRKRPPTGAQRPQPGQILSAPLRLCVSALKTGANQNAKAQRRQVAINQTESRSPPNERSSATAATRRVDCNSDAMPPFTAAHG